jgi:protein phosphatase 1H
METVVNGVEANEENNVSNNSSDPDEEAKRSKSHAVIASGLVSPSEPVPLSEMLPSSSPIPSEASRTTHTPLPNQSSFESIASRLSISSSLHKDPQFTGFVEESLPYTYFAMFDGHAGSAVAVAASLTLHKIIHDKLRNITDLLVTFGLNCETTNNNVSGTRDEGSDDGSSKKNNKNNKNSNGLTTVFESMSLNQRETPDGKLIINHDAHLPRDNDGNLMHSLLFQPGPEKLVTVDSLIIGALELSFWEMDSLIGQDKKFYRMPGGCTVLVSLFILGKLYVANAGDSRAIISRLKTDKNGEPTNEIIEMSYDFTPESERERVKYIGLLKPQLLGNEFTHLEFIKRPTRRDLGKKLLYRDAFMTGWSFKTVTPEDLKFPLVYGDGKRSRVLATIGVTRGFGDHELKAQSSNVDIKPFLTPQPEVKVFDMNDPNLELTDSDVLIMGTDGLWDVVSNEQAAETVATSLRQFPVTPSTDSDNLNDRIMQYRYISAAQDLVMSSRGKLREKGKGWKTADGRVATIDDISVFVIPLKGYQGEYRKWKEAREIVQKTPQTSLSQAMLRQ